jgi:hypothetical protein
MLMMMMLMLTLMMMMMTMAMTMTMTMMMMMIGQIWGTPYPHSPSISLECIDALLAFRADSLALAWTWEMCRTSRTLSSGQQERP